MAVIAAAAPVTGAGASIIPSPARPPAVSASTTAASPIGPWKAGTDATTAAFQAGTDAAIAGWQAGATAALGGWQAGADGLSADGQLGVRPPAGWMPGAGAQGGLQIGAPR
jgi:hypothetical protein